MKLPDDFTPAPGESGYHPFTIMKVKGRSLGTGWTALERSDVLFVSVVVERQLGRRSRRSS